MLSLRRNLPCACPQLTSRPSRRISEEGRVWSSGSSGSSAMDVADLPQLPSPAEIKPDILPPESSVEPLSPSTRPKSKPRRRDKDKDKDKDNDPDGSAKRRCVSTACIACRRRKSKVCITSNLGWHDPLCGHTTHADVLDRCLVRWQYSKLCSLLLRLRNRMHLRPEFGPSPQRSIQEGH